jgi:hypothetical protein
MCGLSLRMVVGLHLLLLLLLLLFLLYSLLCNCDWCCVYKNKNVDNTVDSFTNIILQAMNFGSSIEYH